MLFRSVEPVIEIEEVTDVEDEVYDVEYEYESEEFVDGAIVTLITDDPCFVEGTTGMVQGTPEGFPEMRDVAWSDPDGIITESRHNVTQLVESPF